MDAILIFIIAALSSMLYEYLSNRYGGRGRLKEINKELKELQKKIKSGESKEEEMEKIGKLLMESNIISFKSLIFIIPIIFVGVTIVTTLFPDFTIQLPFHIPIPFRGGGLVEWRDTFGPRGWFFISLFIFGIIKVIYNSAKR